MQLQFKRVCIQKLFSLLSADEVSYCRMSGNCIAFKIFLNFVNTKKAET